MQITGNHGRHVYYFTPCACTWGKSKFSRVQRNWYTYCIPVSVELLVAVCTYMCAAINFATLNITVDLFMIEVWRNFDDMQMKFSARIQPSRVLAPPTGGKHTAMMLERNYFPQNWGRWLFYQEISSSRWCMEPSRHVKTLIFAWFHREIAKMQQKEVIPSPQKKKLVARF